MKKLNGRTIVFAAVLVAMNLVLSRVLAINIGPTIRITIHRGDPPVGRRGQGSHSRQQAPQVPEPRGRGLHAAHQDQRKPWRLPRLQGLQH